MCRVFQVAAETMALWKNLSVLFDKRMEEKEMMINQQAEELNAIRRKVSGFKDFCIMQIKTLRIVYT